MTEPSAEHVNDKTTIAALLGVRNSISAIEFYKAAFDAVELFRIDNDDGAVGRRTCPWERPISGSPTKKQGNLSPVTLSGSTAVRMVMVVDDPDAVFDRAVTATPMRCGPWSTSLTASAIRRLVDPFGHHWEIGKPLISPF